MTITNFINYINDDDDERILIIIIKTIIPNHDILPHSLLYTLYSHSLMHPEQILGSNLLQRPQPDTIPSSNNFHIINTSRRSSWKTTANYAGIVTY